MGHSLKLRTGCRRKLGGVTLLEILVVVGIISVLAALLFPTLRGMMSSADNAKCIANLRATGAMVQALIADSGNRLVTRAGGNGLAGYYFWTDRLWREGYLPEKYKAGTSPGKQALDLLRCPSAPANEGAWYWFTYGLNMYDPRAILERRGENKDATIFELNVARIDNPASYVLLADSITAAGDTQHCRIGIGGTTAFTEGIELRHRGKANAYFLDGHVAALDREDAERLGVPNIYDAFKRD